jgi:DNA-directed RNA polymerase specialized sigma24 family protein
MELAQAVAVVTHLAFRLYNGNEHEVRDLTQDVFERLLRGCRQGNPGHRRSRNGLSTTYNDQSMD